jgi:hypothetical protein
MPAREPEAQPEKAEESLSKPDFRNDFNPAGGGGTL